MSAWNQRNKTKNKGNKPVQAQQSQCPQEGGQNLTNAPSTKFIEAQQRLQESVKKHLKNDYESSSEEEELESDNILGSVLRSYSQIGGTTEDLGRTQNFLENAFHSGAAVCLICIGSVKRTDSIWSCDSCYGCFHLFCIQRWAKDSIAHQKLMLEESGDKKAKITWQCPKCRKDNDPVSIPDRYECFCGKVVEPQFHHWLVPHSCGETCNLPLKPQCGHCCLLLCHPGPCPPCPKMVVSSCYCGRSGKEAVRCSKKERSCSNSCGASLPCRKHPCPVLCHPPPCPPCSKESLIRCNCGSESKLTPCAQLPWYCDKVCGKELSCGLHQCEVVCHKGECSLCPKSLPRSCPCGKETLILPCTEEIGTCGGTCGKLLGCGVHYCSQRCHRGPCGMCLERREKKCRCGGHSKEVSCHKEYLCETKCKRMRDCRTHPCNRKCCDGACPPCEKPCGKTLTCGQHKCGSVCHRGPCYPCNLTKQISCRCGSTVITVPCGATKRRAPPRCNKLCRASPDCHHDTREPHRCHFGSCPPCKQVCKIPKACGHACPESCHSAVLVNIDPDYKPATPWEKMTAPLEIRKLACPPCVVPVLIPCPGAHQDLQFPCHRALSVSCGRLCGRALPCANHSCELMCHKVIGAPNSQESGENCEPCAKECEAERVCQHECNLQCHPPPCPPCQTLLRFRCHCSINQLFIKCPEWVHASDEEKDKLMSCTNHCPKTYSCGHRCQSVCHSGECTGAETCKKKVKLTCQCKRIRKEIPCFLALQSQSEIKCDKVCEEIKTKKLMEEEKGRAVSKEAEERRNREELEQFEKKMQSRRRTRKKQMKSEEDSPSLFSRYKFVFWLMFVPFLIGFSFYLWK